MQTQVVITGDGLTLQKSDGVSLVDFGTTTKFFDGVGESDSNRKLQLAAAGVHVYGDTTNNYAYIYSQGMQVVSASSEVAKFGAETTVGNTSAEHVKITSTALELKTDANNTVLSASSAGLEMSGKIKADSGKIGGFTITDKRLSASGGTGRLLFTTASSAATIGIQAGPVAVSPSDPGRFMVKYNGQVTGSRILMEGGKIGGFDIQEADLKVGGTHITNDPGIRVSGSGIIIAGVHESGGKAAFPNVGQAVYLGLLRRHGDPSTGGISGSIGQAVAGMSSPASLKAGNHIGFRIDQGNYWELAADETVFRMGGRSGFPFIGFDAIGGQMLLQSPNSDTGYGSGGDHFTLEYTDAGSSGFIYRKDSTTQAFEISVPKFKLDLAGQSTNYGALTPGARTTQHIAGGSPILEIEPTKLVYSGLTDNSGNIDSSIQNSNVSVNGQIFQAHFFDLSDTTTSTTDQFFLYPGGYALGGGVSTGAQSAEAIGWPIIRPCSVVGFAIMIKKVTSFGSTDRFDLHLYKGSQGSHTSVTLVSDINLNRSDLGAPNSGGSYSSMTYKKTYSAGTYTLAAEDYLKVAIKKDHTITFDDLLVVVELQYTTRV